MIILREALAQVFQDMDLLVVAMPGYLDIVLHLEEVGDCLAMAPHQVVGQDYQDMVP